MTAIGFGYDQTQWEKFWPANLHVIGKGIARFHAVYWIGMLLSAGVPVPKAISIHGYITADGQKMSKSLGNVIEPYELVKTYGLEPVRYYLLKYIPTHGDGDFSYEKFREVYTADLSNGLGNLCSRVAKLAEKNGSAFAAPIPTQCAPKYSKLLADFQISDALHWVMNQVSQTDQFLSETKPWTQTGDDQAKNLQTAIDRIVAIAYHLQPFLPQTSATILRHFTQPTLTALSPLFPRLPEVK
jgi:methionyl-tRNA synthetase